MLPFQYERLLEHDSIRLLVLEPSVEHSATIQCSLIHTTLDACKNDIIDHYTALSYVWGDPETSESILVAEKVFNITKNLFHALQDLRDNDRRRRLWIDAICIDQSNLFERNGQVSMMGSIYTQAQHTVIYLGRSTFGTELNFEVFSTNTTAVQNPIQRSSGIRSVAEEILSRPWFTRVWIFQELVLSQDPWIQCGRSRMQWDEALGAIQSRSTCKRSGGSFKRRNSTRQYLVLNWYRSYNHGVDLERLTQGIGYLLIWGLPPPCTRIQFKMSVDYGKSAAQVFIDLAKKIILSTRCLDILRFVDTSWPANRYLELPSWVPNWSLPMAHDPHPPTISPTYIHPVAINDGSGCSHSQMYKIWLQDFPVLNMDGFKLDVVVNVSPAIPDYDLSRDHENSQVLDTLNDSVGWEKCWQYYCNAYDGWRGKNGFKFLYPLLEDISADPETELSYHFRDAGRIQFQENENSLSTLLVNHSSRRYGFPSMLTGRNVASFQTFPGKFGLVPPSTRPGDLLCQLSPESRVILRPLDHVEERLDDTVAAAIKQYEKSYQELLEPPGVLSVAHVSYVGECVLYHPVPGINLITPFGDPRMFVIH